MDGSDGYVGKSLDAYIKDKRIGSRGRGRGRGRGQRGTKGQARGRLQQRAVVSTRGRSRGRGGRGRVAAQRKIRGARSSNRGSTRNFRGRNQSQRGQRVRPTTGGKRAAILMAQRRLARAKYTLQQKRQANRNQVFDARRKIEESYAARGNNTLSTVRGFSRGRGMRSAGRGGIRRMAGRGGILTNSGRVDTFDHVPRSRLAGLSVTVGGLRSDGMMQTQRLRTGPRGRWAVAPNISSGPAGLTISVANTMRNRGQARAFAHKTIHDPESELNPRLQQEIAAIQASGSSSSSHGAAINFRPTPGTTARTLHDRFTKGSGTTTKPRYVFV